MLVPKTIGGYGALPDLSYKLKKGASYTIILEPTGYFYFPPIEKIEKELESRIYPPIIDVVSITWSPLKRYYTILFTPKIDIEFGKMLNYIRTVFTDMIGRTVTVIDFITAFEPTPSKTKVLPEFSDIKKLIYITAGTIAIIYLVPFISKFVKGR